MCRAWMILSAIGVGLLMRPMRSQAVVIGSNPADSNTNAMNGVAPEGFPGWNNVGAVNGASGIYLGNGWVLTADHVNAGPITFGAQTFNPNGNTVRLDNPSDHSPTDIVLFQLTTLPNLPNLSLATTSPIIGTPYLNIGFGLNRNTALQSYDSNFAVITTGTPTYQGYGFGSANVKSWGTNAIVNLGTIGQPDNLEVINVGFGNLTVFGGTFSQDTDQIVSGDSGGAVFNANTGQLIGMNDAIDLYDGQPFGIALFGNDSLMADLATYSTQIEQITGVPEPTCVGVLAFAGLGLVRRPYRGQRSKTSFAEASIEERRDHRLQNRPL